jgi:hypothetical protein
LVDPNPIVHSFIERVTPKLLVANATIFNYFKSSNPECPLLRVTLVEDQSDKPLNATRAEMIKINPVGGNFTVVTQSRVNETVQLFIKGVTFGGKVAYQPVLIEWKAPYNGPPAFASKIPAITLTINRDEQLAGLPEFKYTSPRAVDAEGDTIFMEFSG